MGVKKKRIYIVEQIEDMTSVFDGSSMNLADSIRILTEKLTQYSRNGYVRLWIEIGEPSYEYEFSIPSLWGERLENDREYEKRIRKKAIEEERKKQKKENIERQEKIRLRQLMKKYPEELTQGM